MCRVIILKSGRNCKMSQMKLFGSRRSAARLAKTRAPKKKKPLKKLAIFLTVILCLEGLYFFAAYTTIPFVAQLRDTYINTALATMRHQWLATRLLPKSVVQDVIDRNTAAAARLDGKTSSWGKTDPETPATDEPSTDVPEQPDTTPAQPEENTRPIDTEVQEPEPPKELTPEEIEAQEKAAFEELFWELDPETWQAYLTEHPETLDNGWSGIYINEAGLNDNGTSIYTTQGEQVLAIDAPNKILFVRVKGSGWRGVLAIAKDPSLLCIGTSANISQGTDPFSKGSGQTVGEIVQNVEGGILGITASGFIDVSPNGVLGQGNGGRLAGYCMAQGTEYNVDYHATNSGWHKFSRMELHDDNLMYIKATTDPISENCTDAFEFEPAMIVDGEVLVNDWWSELNPRSCIGQSDKYEILMLVIEGRGASGSWGTDIAHCAEILKNHNCEQAINVDGGASGMMWYNGEYLTRCANGVSSDGRPVPNACVYRAAGYDSDTPSGDTQ